jgi:hypothetical protein
MASGDLTMCVEGVSAGGMALIRPAHVTVSLKRLYGMLVWMGRIMVIMSLLR